MKICLANESFALGKLLLDRVHVLLMSPKAHPELAGKGLGDAWSVIQRKSSVCGHGEFILGPAMRVGSSRRVEYVDLSRIGECLGVCVSVCLRDAAGYEGNYDVRPACAGTELFSPLLVTVSALRRARWLKN